MIAKGDVKSTKTSRRLSRTYLTILYIYKYKIVPSPPIKNN